GCSSRVNKLFTPELRLYKRKGTHYNDNNMPGDSPHFTRSRLYFPSQAVLFPCLPLAAERREVGPRGRTHYSWRTKHAATSIANTPSLPLCHCCFRVRFDDQRHQPEPVRLNDPLSWRYLSTQELQRYMVRNRAGVRHSASGLWRYDRDV